MQSIGTVAVTTRLQLKAQERTQGHIPDTNMAASMQLPQFIGGTNAQRFLKSFQDFCIVSNVKPEQKIVFFGLALKETANDWFYTLPDETRKVWAELQSAFTEQHEMSASQKIDKLGQFFTSQQEPSESASDYIIRMVNLSGSEVSEETAVHIIVKGLNKDLRPFILAKEPKSLKDLNQLVKKAQGTSENEKVSMLQQQVESLQQQMEANFEKLTAKLTIANITPAYPQRSRSPYPRSQVGEYRKRSLSNQGNRNKTTTSSSGQGQQGQGVSWAKACRYCREYHSFNQKCPKFKNKKCFRCGTMGHIQSQCRKGYQSNYQE